MKQMLKLADKDSKAVSMSVFHTFKTESTGMKDKKIQIKFLEMKIQCIGWELMLN